MLGNSNSFLRFCGVFSLAFSTIYFSAYAVVASEEPEPFVFCYEDTELYPSFVGNSAKVPEKGPGVFVDLMKLIGTRAGLDTHFVRFPWKRCLTLLEIGRVDGVIAAYNERRSEFGAYPMLDGKPDESLRISTEGYFLYQLAETTPLWDGANFGAADVAIGAPLGYSIVDLLQDRELFVVEAGNITGLLYMLQRGRVGAVAAPGLATDSVIRRDPERYSNIVRLPQPLQVKPYYLVLSYQFLSKSRKKAHEIWQATKVLREEAGDKLRKKY